MPDRSRQSGASSYETLLLKSLRRALGPLIRFLLHRGITFPVLSTLVKGLYIEHAQKEFQQGDRPLTDSRLSLLTGIARRYVKEIRQSEKDENTRVQIKVSPGGKLIAEWTTIPAYLDNEGRPIAIPRLAGTTDKQPSFEALAQKVNSDVWPAAMLEKLLEMKLVEIDEHDRVHLLADAYLPSNTSRESLVYFAEHLHDHIATLNHNMQGIGEPMMERSAYVSHLTRSSIECIQKSSEQKASELLREVYTLASEHCDANTDDTMATHRLRLGVYFYTEDMSDAQAQEAQNNEEQ